MTQKRHWHPLGENILAKYTVKLMQRASGDLDDIYNHIADDFKEIGTVEKTVDVLEDAILSLDGNRAVQIFLIYKVQFDIM